MNFMTGVLNHVPFLSTTFKQNPAIISNSRAEKPRNTHGKRVTALNDLQKVHRSVTDVGIVVCAFNAKIGAAP